MVSTKLKNSTPFLKKRKLFLKTHNFIQSSKTFNSKWNLNFDHLNILNSNISTFELNQLNGRLNKTKLTNISLKESRVNDQNMLNYFVFLRQSTIKTFFILNMIDVPVCFQKSKSLYTKTFELPLLKFTNFLMRDGKREKIFKNFTLALTQFITKFLSNVLNVSQYNNFLTTYLLFNKYFLETTSNKTQSFFLKTLITLKSKHTVNDKDIILNNDAFMKYILFDKLREYLPLFSFYIRKVDKNIRKHSRGKSGKYTLMWKYVPTYKRFYLTMRWLLKDIKFQKLKTFQERLFKTFELLFISPQLSFVCKLRKFIHFFVFQNFKKTLLKTLKSTS